MKNKTLITAHTGADRLPDNSLEFVRYAAASDADAFEIDIRKNPDGVLVLAHDLDGREVPTLREAFEIAKSNPRIQINCDLKNGGLELDVLSLVREFGFEGRIIYSGSVSVAVLREHPELQDAITIYLNLEEYVKDLYDKIRDVPDFDVTAAEEIIDVCKKYGVHVVNSNYKVLTERFIEMLREAGIGVSAWTVNEYEDAARLISQRVHNLTTRSLSMVMERC
ncbi:MAG: glycerophosphodiester phosphodiesterase [Eubacteriales bacterium]